MAQSGDHWHSIRPWIHRLALSVDQVSSVSATFTLKSALTTKPLDPALEAILEDEREDPPCSSTEHPDPHTRSCTVSDALAQGLSVKVNSSPWQRVVLRVDEESDEAIIVVFGLMPGRQYDVELGISHRQGSLRSQITTGDACKRFLRTFSHQGACFLHQSISNTEPWASFYPAPDQTVSNPHSNVHDLNDTNGSTVMPFVVSTSDTTVATVPRSLTTPPGPTPSPSPTPSPTLSTSTSGDATSSVSTPSMTLENRVQQLNQTLSLLQSERDSLSLSLKTTRRDAQRADAAIRADIDTLKRSSDKFASIEHRARQKVLALQEAVKQTLTAAADINAAVTDVETSMPVLREQHAEAEKESDTTKQQAAQAREEREALEHQEKRRIDNLQTELAGLGCKLDKLIGKREKLETSIIPDLEEELRRIEEEIAEATGPLPPVAGRFDDAHHYELASFGTANQSGSSSALSNLGIFPNDLHLTTKDPLPTPIENPRRRKHLSHPPPTTKRQVQKPVQILRPLHQQHQHKPTAAGGTTTSTLSSLAAPFEPSPKRQAQLQGSLGAPLNSSNITSTLKGELNSTSSVFAPRMGFTTSSTSATSISTTTPRKSAGANPNNSSPGHSTWSRGGQKPRRSDME